MLTYDITQKGNQTLYEYLYQCIKEDILTGKLKSLEKLPSKRQFARQYQISLKTVENAYEQLLLEGYIYAREKSGYYVNQQVHRSLYEGAMPPHAILQEKKEVSFVDLTSNQSAADRFPFSTWSKVMREVLGQQQEHLMETVSFQGVYELREQIAKHLYEYRGMQVTPEQIIIGAGTEYLYTRLIQLLGRQCIYAVEDPGYRKIPMLYQANDVAWEYIGIDEEGLLVEELAGTSASVVHVSAGHHFPTGTVMSADRRRKLLEWARAESDRYIIEDDYDSEFRFSRRPIPAIQSMDRNHRVIYVNTFSKTLIPTVRISYMVLPPKLMDRYISTMNFYSCSASVLEQYAMAEFMRRGCFDRHLQRMKHYYREKRDAMLSLLEQSSLAPYIRIEEKDAGNHFLLELDTRLSDTELKWIAKENGIFLECLSEYCQKNRERYQHIVIVNYSDLDVNTFAQVLEQDIFCRFR